MTAVKAKTDSAIITVRNPADGRVVGAVPIDDADTVAAKACALRAAQPEWEEIGPRGRKRWLLEFQGWILDNADHITGVVMSETGKSRNDAGWKRWVSPMP
jgi:acyl-CoA reductase-like NAD-dependent aldehyde dehydrogenase